MINRRRGWLFTTVSLLSCIASGCSPGESTSSLSPNASANAIQLSPSATAVHDEPRLNDGPLPESQYKYLGRLDKERIAAKLVEYRAPFKPQPRPEGMDDDVYERCRRILEDKSEATELLALDKAETGDIKMMRFIENKYLVILSDKLTVWRVEDKQKVKTYELPEPGVVHLHIGKDTTQALLGSKTKLYKFSFTESKVVNEVEIPEEILSLDLARESGDVAVCTQAKRLISVSSDLKQRIDGPDLNLASARISVHPYGSHILCNTEQMTRWNVKPSKVDNFDGSSFHPQASIPSAGLLFDRWISPFAIHELRDGVHTRTIRNTRNPPLPMSSVLVLTANCASPTFWDWSVVLTFDKELNSKKMSVFDVMPFSESASVPTSLSSVPITKWCVATNGERIAFLNSSGLHVVSRKAWICRTGTADALSIGNLLEQGRFKQLEIAAEYLRRHKRLPRGIGGEELYADIVGYAAEIWRCLNTTTQAELLKQLEKWRQEESIFSILVSASMHAQLKRAARGNEAVDTVPDENWKTVHDENTKLNAELAKIDYLKLPPAVAYSLALSTDGDFVSDPAVMDQMLLDYTHNYPWEIDVHVSRGLSCLPRWGGEDRQIGAYVSELAAAYPPKEAERCYTHLATILRSKADEMGGENFGYDYVRLKAGLRDMIKDSSLRQDCAERALYPWKRKLHDEELVKELSDYHVKHFNVNQAPTYTGAVVSDIYRARNRAYYGTENPQAKQ